MVPYFCQVQLTYKIPMSSHGDWKIYLPIYYVADTYVFTLREGYFYGSIKVSQYLSVYQVMYLSNPISKSVGFSCLMCWYVNLSPENKDII